MPARLQTHNDLPTLEDRLGREKLLYQVAHDIAHGRPPFVFAVHGDWGAGKTSFLRQLENELCGKTTMDAGSDAPRRKFDGIHNVFPVWFEAWQYQHESAPVVALLHEIVRQLPTHEGLKRAIKKWTSVTVKGVASAITTASGKITAEVGIPGVMKFAKEAGVTVENPFNSIRREAAKWELDQLASPLGTDQVRTLLNDAIGELLGREKNRRVCVIIDDLDRCAPEAAWRLLEGIKVHLSLPQCVFVLGVNLQQLRHAIASHMPGGEERPAQEDEARTREYRAQCEAAAAEYLEKLCTFSWKLPLPTPTQQADGLRHWLQEPPEAAGRDNAALPSSLVDALCQLAEKYGCLPANPRKIKGLANALRSLAAQAWPADKSQLIIPDDEAPSLLASACLYHFHPDIVRYLQADRSMYQRLRDWVARSPTKDADLVEEDLGPPEVREPPTHPALAMLKASIPGRTDPVDLRVFRVGELLRSPTHATTITAQRLSRYLGNPV